MATYFSPDVLRQAASLFRAYGSTSAAARAANVSRRTMRERIKHIYDHTPDLLKSDVAPLPSPKAVTVENQTAPTPAPAAPQEDPKPSRYDIEIMRRDTRIQELTARLKAVQEQVIAVEDERDTFKTLRNTNLPKVHWPSGRQSRLGTNSNLIPILFTSDFQYGEVIRPEELDGMNAYNKEIFAERYTTMIDKTIDLAENHTGASDFPGIFYLRGGDAISGNIHDELCDTNDLSAIPACRLLLAHEREGIKRLKDAFGRVHVISIPGNHGRTTHKSRAKSYVDFSYESALSWWLASTFEDDTRVTFQAPASGDAYFEVLGWKFLLSHGDRIGSRGGAGFVGPAATISRGHQKLLQNWMLSGKPIDYILTGHLHTSLKLQHGFANGSVAGYNEYAQMIRAAPDSAKQWLIFVSEEYGAAQNFEIILSDRPNRVIN